MSYLNIALSRKEINLLRIYYRISGLYQSFGIDRSAWMQFCDNYFFNNILKKKEICIGNIFVQNDRQIGLITPESMVKFIYINIKKGIQTHTASQLPRLIYKKKR